MLYDITLSSAPVSMLQFWEASSSLQVLAQGIERMRVRWLNGITKLNGHVSEQTTQIVKDGEEARHVAAHGVAEGQT